MSRSLKRLRRLVDIRRRQEESARSALADSLRHASEISEEVRLRSEALGSVMSGDTPVSRRQAEPLVAAAGNAIAAAKAAESSAYATVEEIKKDWMATATRLQGAERLTQRATEAERELELSQDRVAVDEAVTSRSNKHEEGEE